MYLLTNNSLLIILLFITFLFLFATLSTILKQHITNHSKIEPFYNDVIDCSLPRYYNIPCCRAFSTNKKLQSTNIYKSYPSTIINKKTQSPVHIKDSHKLSSQEENELLNLNFHCNSISMVTQKNEALPFVTNDDTERRYLDELYSRDNAEKLMNESKNKYDAKKIAFDNLNTQYETLLNEYNANYQEFQRLLKRIQDLLIIIKNMDVIDKKIAIKTQIQLLEENASALITDEHNLKDKFQNIIKQAVDFIMKIPILYINAAILYEHMLKSKPFAENSEYKYMKKDGESTLETQNELKQIRSTSRQIFHTIQKNIQDLENKLKLLIVYIKHSIFENKLLQKARQAGDEVNFQVNLPISGNILIEFNDEQYFLSRTDIQYYRELQINKLFSNEEQSEFESLETKHRLTGDSSKPISALENTLRRGIILNVSNENRANIIAEAVIKQFLSTAIKTNAL